MDILRVLAFFRANEWVLQESTLFGKRKLYKCVNNCKYKLFKKEPKKPLNVSTYIFCRKCNKELIYHDNNGFKKIRTGIYSYICPRCGTKSIFAFNIAPVPILITEEALKEKLYK